MKDEPYNSPQKPFGGDEDYIWSPKGYSIIYVSKKKKEQNMLFQQILICMNMI